MNCPDKDYRSVMCGNDICANNTIVPIATTVMHGNNIYANNTIVPIGTSARYKNVIIALYLSRRDNPLFKTMAQSITIQKQQVPAPGLGTYQLTGKQGERAISQAISLGYRHIDTAQFYHNEEDVGNAVNNSGVARNQLFITTKIWPTDFVKKNSISFVEQSLQKLKLDQVDLLLLHWPADDSGNEKGIDMLLQAQHKQYTRLIGVSNFNVSQLEKARKRILVFCNQIEFHPYINQSEMLEYGKKNDLLLTAYTPLARGKVNKDSTIISLAEKYGKTPTQITLRWLLQQKNVCPIPKGGSEKHLLENLQLFDFQIQNEDMETISDINFH